MPDRRRLRFAARSAFLLVIAFLILQALGYGLGFFFDPASGVGEFASQPSDPTDELTIALVGLVGVGMLGTAGMLGLAAALTLKGNPAGTYIGMVLGAVYILAGVSAARAGWTWDAYFYGGTGGLLILSAIFARWSNSNDATGG